MSGPLALLRGRVASCCTVRGYPTTRRPEGFAGLELSWYNLLAIAQRPILVAGSGHTGSRRVLLGSSATLQLVKVSNGVSLWHITNPSACCRSCLGRYSQGESDGKLKSLGFEALASYRHILGACSEGETCVGETPHVEPLRKNQLDADMACAPAAFLAREIGCSPSECMAFNNSPGNSIETDMVSISNTSENTKVEPLGTDNVLFPIIEAVRLRLLAGFGTLMTTHTPSQSDGSSSTNQGSTSEISAPRPAAAAPEPIGRSRARLFSQRDGEDDDDDGSGCPRPKKLKRAQQESTQKTLACHFWKFDPVQHRSCFSLRLSTVPRVKQHLMRNHVPEFYCQRCLVIFQDDESHTAHIMCPGEYGCAPDPLARLNGISSRQHQQLSRKPKTSALSESDKWYTIWDIVFPDQPRPPSPYMDSRITEDCALFRSYSLEHGPDMVLREVEDSGVLSATDLDAESRRNILRQAIARGLNAISSTWDPPRQGSSQSAESQPAEASLLGSSRPPNDLIVLDIHPRITQSSNGTDSGVGLSSHVSEALSSQPQSRGQSAPGRGPFHYSGRSVDAVRGVQATEHGVLYPRRQFAAETPTLPGISLEQLQGAKRTESDQPGTSSMTIDNITAADATSLAWLEPPSLSDSIFSDWFNHGSHEL